MKKKEDGLGAWHLTMMALGSVIGGSFFLGSAVAIHAAGPAVLVAFAFGGILVYFILSAISEMTVVNPDAGSFRTFAAKTLGPGSGFVVGWVYWTGMVLAISSEATAVSILIQHWIPNLPIWILGSVIIIAVTLINLLSAKQLSKLESSLAFIKVFAIISFILIGISIILGLFKATPALGFGALKQEPFSPGGWKSLAGSMLIVMFTYAGFEVIGLASSETSHPKETIPRATRYTVLSLVSLYLFSNAILLPLIPTADVSENLSPIVAALNGQGVSWAGTVINIVLITAILSTMLAVMFAIGRMIHSLAEDGLSPRWLKEKTDVPYRGILFSGLFMLFALWFGMFFPRVYLFLISSGGFAILFCYVMIMITHIRFRTTAKSSKSEKNRARQYPYASLFTLLALLASILSMPFVEGQTSGLIAGMVIVTFYSLSYLFVRAYQYKGKRLREGWPQARKLQFELSEELSVLDDDLDSERKQNNSFPDNN